MPALWIHSPNALLAAALGLHVAGLGYELAASPDEGSAALVDLCSLRGALPPPPPLPSLALVPMADPAKLELLLLLGYRGYLRPHDPAALLGTALETLLAGGVWRVERRPAQSLTPSQGPAPRHPP